MKKLMYVEIVVLALLLVAAILACTGLTRQAFAPDIPDSTQNNAEETGQTQETTGATETTEAPTIWQPDWKTYPESRQLLAQQYFVYDCVSEQFLTISGSQSDRIYPASITKLATALVAMEHLEPDTVIKADNVLDLVAWGSSVADLQLGDSLTAEQLIEAMLLPSGNDAAYVLAAAAGREIAGNPSLPASEAVSMFMFVMNARVVELGMTDSHFVNPDGIHDGNHYMTFSDLAVLGKLSMENETIMKYANIAKEQVTLHGEEVEWKNTNALINPETEYYCQYAVGLKTGQTPSAGSCLLSAFRMDEHELIIGVFGCPEIDDRFDDTLQLFNEVVLD